MLRLNVTYGLVAQLGAHHIRIVGVGSSNLLESTKQKAPPKGWCFLLGGRRFEPLNSPVQWTGECRRLDDGKTNTNESPRVHQRITVILIQRNDGYFMPKISILRTLGKVKHLTVSFLPFQIVKIQAIVNLHP